MEVNIFKTQSTKVTFNSNIPLAIGSSCLINSIWNKLYSRVDYYEGYMHHQCQWIWFFRKGRYVANTHKNKENES